MDDVVIVGAGPAGLAIAYQLSRLDARYRLVDGSRELASSWRARHARDGVTIAIDNGFLVLDEYGFPRTIAAESKNQYLSHFQESSATSVSQNFCGNT